MLRLNDIVTMKSHYDLRGLQGTIIQKPAQGYADPIVVRVHFEGDIVCSQKLLEKIKVSKKTNIKHITN